ncbi:MAG: hypothetical protein AAF847_18095 [Bacteroidota bacterium]
MGNIHDWVELGLFVITFIGLVVTIFSHREQLKSLNQQLKLNFFADYTRRYQEIMLHLPMNIYEDTFSFETMEAADRESCLKYIRAYFNLCSEEYDLWRSGNIEQRIWERWEEGIRATIATKAFYSAWHIAHLSTYYYPEFVDLIENMIKERDQSL